MGKGGEKSSGADLDVHAISHLKDIGVPPTDDSFKYRYMADSTDAKYCQSFAIWRKTELGARMRAELSRWL